MKKLARIEKALIVVAIMAAISVPTATAGIVGSDGYQNSTSIGIVGSDGSSNSKTVGIVGSDGKTSARSIGIVGSDGKNSVRQAGIVGSDGSSYGIVGSDGKGVWSVALSFSPRLASLIMRMGLI
jgi:uncharacterized Ntn-hydrolase superfamily protein